MALSSNLVRTCDFQSHNTGSNPVGAAIYSQHTMDNQNKELVHSFNVCLDSKIVELFRNEQEKLLKEFKEKRFYDSTPHLSTGAKFMDESKTNEFVNALKKEFENDKVWELEFSHCSLSKEGNYIFIHFSEESRKKLFELHRRAFKATEGIGYEGQGGLPPKYDYDPHLSVIKLEPTESARAVALINTDFHGVRMAVKLYEITRQQEDENGFSNFPVVGKIFLKS